MLSASYHRLYLYWSPPLDDDGAADDVAFDGDVFNAFVGQRNGVLGVARPGDGVIFTGLHTGDVGVRAEYCAGEPPLDEAWEDVVEGSIELRLGELHVAPWGKMGDSLILTLPTGPLRVRLSCRGRDDEFVRREQDGDDDGDVDDEERMQNPREHLLLQFWRAPVTPDAIIRTTSEQAAYQHAERE